MKYFIQIIRSIVGIWFIFSGLVKLNDPMGFSFKLEEYFSADVLNLPFFVPFALTIALIVVIVEVMLGVFLLIGFKRNITLWSLLFLTIFFTFLTFYSAYFNKVTDCGCFGDAIKFTPWESFSKDVLLLFFILFLFAGKRFITPLFTSIAQYTLVVLTFVGCLFLGYYVLNHLPVVDFRAYKVGTNIQKGMELPAGAAKSEYEMIFIYNVNGKDTEFTEADVMANKIPASATFVDRKDKLLKQGFIPPIHDFSMELNGADYKDELLEAPKLIMIVCYDMQKANPEGLKKLNKLFQKGTSLGYKVIGMSATDPMLIEKFKQKFKIPFEFYFCDGTTLKTIERPNPSIVFLEKGTITKKLHWNDAFEF